MVKSSENIGEKIFEEPRLLLSEKDKLKPRQTSIRIAMIYMVLGSLWILMSDELLALLVTDAESVKQISIAKGWLFVIATGILVYTLVNSTLVKLRAAEDKLYINYQSMVDTNLELASAYYHGAESQNKLRLHNEQLVENQKKLEDSERELEYQAYHDQITGAQNKLSMMKHLSELARTRGSSRIAIMIVDIDNFKFINDTMGHSFGDQMLVKVCSHLEDLIGEDSSIFRLSGDGFVIVFENFNETSQAEKLAVRLLKGFKSPFELDGSSLFITISMGIALYPEHGDNMEELLKNADIALYKAKDTGKNRIVFYNKPMDEAVSERVYIEKHLRTALENNELELYYQPQMDISTKNVSGLEALIRWNSPELGFVSPLRFISIAEDTHMIIPIGEWVLRNACIYLKKLHQQGCEELTMSVNISMIQLIQEDFLDMVMDTLNRVKLNPEYLELEITESTLMESFEVIESKLDHLKKKGFKIALDDFGKGYSSLNYLRQLPIATLKIDKSFIDTIGSKGKTKSLTSLMVKIGKTMGLNVVAEGVETQEQLDYLVKNKCDRMQGYLYSKPMPEELVTAFLTKKEWNREMTKDNKIVEENTQEARELQALVEKFKI